ncbi:hypothetical protein LTR97_009806 [Elasticomyces elasticus]|uniref:Uncharacterized protein n=1 Tax=Elasticomyces elasticus TaxID=574655 RepID=A0AAN7ZZJ3_9PEZI|nr:hypothetical protein LTR97_009806 [Elasticomyces elasticus]
MALDIPGSRDHAPDDNKHWLQKLHRIRDRQLRHRTLQTSRLPLEAVDLLFANRSGGRRPNILEVVRDSTNKAFMADVHATLEERARYGAEATKTEKPKAVAEIESTAEV